MRRAGCRDTMFERASRRRGASFAAALAWRHIASRARSVKHASREPLRRRVACLGASASNSRRALLGK
eukprot:11219585-Lingulodinium_polyedra.AAC.1